MTLKEAGLPKIAILLATYNGKQFITSQIRSLLAQGSVGMHLYVHDDGSSDETPTILEQSRSDHSAHITICSIEVLPTGSAAKNFFLLLQSVDLSDYDYVAFSDQDDLWLPGKLERAVQCIGGQGGGGYSSNLLAWNEKSGESWIVDKAGKRKPLDYLFQGASAGCTYVLDRPSATLVQHRLRQLTVPYCDGISHDWVVYAICRSAGFRWYYDDEFHIFYRQHETNVYGAMPGIRGMLARAKMLRAGWYKNHILWLSNVIENHVSETEIMSAVRRGSLGDRLMLIRNAGNFRRKAADVWKLRLAIATGLLR